MDTCMHWLWGEVREREEFLLIWGSEFSSQEDNSANRDRAGSGELCVRRC